MGYKIKVFKKTGLPDEREVMETVGKFGRGLVNRAKSVWVAVALILGTTVVAGGVYLYNWNAERTSRDLLNQATGLYLNRALNNPEAAVSHTRQAVEIFRRIVDDYPGSSSAPLALHLLGNASLVLNDREGAIQSYERFLKDAPLSSALRPLVYQRLAYTYWEIGDLKKAEDALSTVLTMHAAPNKDQALFELAALSEQQQQTAGALARYQELIKNYPHSVYLSLASEKVKALGGGQSASRASNSDALEQSDDLSSEPSASDPSASRTK